MAKLIEALQLPSMVTDMTLRFPADGMATMEVTRLLSPDEVQALSEWFLTEGISPIQTGTTTYSLERREQADDGNTND